ncbi:DUF6270 domain-containing protein [Glycomyces tritici]|uniref:DUF6270 domain-containing protein n=1 Tax=Glycomyces tritici TaxID=2665176 RepID=A0ABT7YP86_9ACTN|nr:DUF6270 domain-containing protein [Glycomyces tritici]MDN3240063.1 DUF6270 domain-containing protein [Glycomyces tritici]
MEHLPPTYSLIGCCVTRDAADLGRDPLPAPVHFVSRTRVQSLVSTPTPIRAEDIALDSAFQRRTIVEDHLKTGLDALEGIDHPLVIDLIDERWPLIETGSGLVTSTIYLRSAGLDQRPGYAPYGNDTELADDGPFATAARALVARLPRQVLIHRAFWAVNDTAGRPVSDLRRTRRNNTWLERAYAILEAALGDRALPPVEVDASLRIADPGHRWGPGPYHYIDEYYTDFSEQVRKVLANAPAR